MGTTDPRPGVTPRLTTAPLLQEVDRRTDLSPAQLRAAFDALLDATLRALHAGQRVTWPGLGTFELRSVPELSGVNRRSGEKVVRPARLKVVFRRSAALDRPGWFEEDGVTPGQAALDEELVQSARLMHRREYPAWPAAPAPGSGLAELLEVLDEG